MQLTIIDPRPKGSPDLLIPAAVVILGVVMVAAGGATDGVPWLAIGVGCVWGWSETVRHRGATRMGDAWIARVQQTVETLGTESARLPSVDSPIPLRATEVCHWVGEIEWQEMRSRTRTVRYSGGSVSIPVVKGVRYRVGTVTPQRETVTEVETIDAGRLVITSRRIFFDGNQRNTTIELRHLIGVGLDGRTILLDRSSGRDPRLRVIDGDDPVVAAVILARLVTDYTAGQD